MKISNTHTLRCISILVIFIVVVFELVLCSSSLSLFWKSISLILTFSIGWAISNLKAFEYEYSEGFITIKQFNPLYLGNSTLYLKIQREKLIDFYIEENIFSRKITLNWSNEKHQISKTIIFLFAFKWKQIFCLVNSLHKIKKQNTFPHQNYLLPLSFPESYSQN